MVLNLGNLAIWSEPAPADDLPASVRRIAETLLSAGYPHIELLADAVGMSVRTLQRRLAEAGDSYEHLIAQARYTSAARLLEATNAKVLDIALDLGYSDHAHFTRAFRRWTGVSPREFRRLSRQAPAPTVAS